MDRKSRIMENKYYTPDLSEFHIGFEYEWLDENQVWNKAVPTEITENNYNDQLYGLRVKYLDKSDIESLDFEVIEESDVDNIFFLKFSMNSSDYTYYELEYFNWYVGAKDTETTEHRMVRITRRYKDEEKGVSLFRGEIKNKSELNKLLKQLRIKENE